MEFKVGDKIRVTEDFLLKLPELTDQVKDGGVIIKIFGVEARIRFYSGRTYNIFFSSLELKSVENQQLLFEFMEQS